MAAGDTTVGMSVTWNGEEIGTYVSDPSLQVSCNPVDCTAVADARQDNRAGITSVTASMTVILKDSETAPMANGDYGILGVDGEEQDVLVGDVTYGGGNNAPHTVSFSFVSTNKEISS